MDLLHCRTKEHKTFNRISLVNKRSALTKNLLRLRMVSARRSCNGRHVFSSSLHLAPDSNLRRPSPLISSSSRAVFSLETRQTRHRSAGVVSNQRKSLTCSETKAQLPSVASNQRKSQTCSETKARVPLAASNQRKSQTCSAPKARLPSVASIQRQSQTCLATMA